MSNDQKSLEADLLTDADDEVEIERLLNEVGARAEPTAEMMQAVHAAVHAEWQTMVAQRSRRKQGTIWSIAATVVVALGAVLLWQFSAGPRALPVNVASIANIQHTASVGTAQVSTNAGVTWHDVVLGEVLAVGAEVRTDATTRAALDFGKGLSVRIDAGSHVQLLAADRVSLERGRIYIDAPPHVLAPLSVLTAFGAVRHLGTQYQVQLAQDRMTVSVREGRVVIAGQYGEGNVVANESVVYGARGEIARAAMTPHDSTWQWAMQAAPAIDIDNHSLAMFLDWVARESGRTLTYSTAEARTQAEQLVLRGSVAALSPDQALRAVMATTQFVHTETAGAIHISLPK